ncbi:hypothetical protein OSTOST_12464, partial [Ostertagia ostertagi]
FIGDAGITIDVPKIELIQEVTRSGFTPIEYPAHEITRGFVKKSCRARRIHYGRESEEEVRKLSEVRKMKILDRRRKSTQENPNGIPIMQAFQKAYQEVRCGRRRSIQDFEFCKVARQRLLHKMQSPAKPQKAVAFCAIIAEKATFMHTTTYISHGTSDDVN